MQSELEHIPPDPKNDLDFLLQQCQAGDEAAWRVFGEQFFPAAYRLALLLCGSPERAEAAALEALAGLLQEAEATHFERDYHAWLAEKALRACRQRAVSPPRDHPGGVLELTLALSESQRLVYALVEIGGLSVEGAAGLTGLGVAEAYTLLDLARERLEALGRRPHPQFRTDLSESLAAASPSGDHGERFIQAYRKLGARRTARLRLAELGWFGVVLAMILGMGLAIDWWTPLPETPVQKVVITVLATPAPTSTVTPTPTATQYPPRAVLYTVQEAGSLAEVAARIGVPAVILGSLNNLAVDATVQAGKMIMVGVGVLPQAMITPTPVTPVALPPPLTVNSPAGVVLRRIEQSRGLWRTAWLDARIIEYGPPAYLGPPQIRREQVWVSQPLFSLVLAGDDETRVARYWINNAVQTVEFDMISGERTWFSSGGNLFYADLNELIFPVGWLGYRPAGDLQILHTETVAGRDCLVIDLTDSAAAGQGRPDAYLGRFWVDTSTGMILRRQVIDQNSETLIRDTIVTRLALNVDLPPGLFDPNQFMPGGFAQDYQATMTAVRRWGLEDQQADLPIAPPRPTVSAPPVPPGFDPSRSQLEFLITETADLRRGPFTFLILAGGYRLGELEMGATWDPECTRSPDGGRIAYLYHAETDNFQAALRWVDLDDLGQVREALPGLYGYQMAFDWSGEFLAYLACGSRPNRCNLYQVALATGETSIILQVEYASRLFWSPQGDALGFIGSLPGDDVVGLYVVQLSNRQVIYRGDFDPAVNAWPADAPPVAWGVDLSLAGVRQDLTACAAPPG